MECVAWASCARLVLSCVDESFGPWVKGWSQGWADDFLSPPCRLTILRLRPCTQRIKKVDKNWTFGVPNDLFCLSVGSTIIADL